MYKLHHVFKQFSGTVADAIVIKAINLKSHRKTRFRLALRKGFVITQAVNRDHPINTCRFPFLKTHEPLHMQSGPVLTQESA